MASSPITSQQTDREKVETVADFKFLGSTITAHGDCSREIKRRLLPGRKVVTKPRVLKSTELHFADKGPPSQSYVFSVVMYRCESWTVKRAECRRIDPFKL